jgi:hypothetical protein
VLPVPENVQVHVVHLVTGVGVGVGVVSFFSQLNKIVAVILNNKINFFIFLKICFLHQCQMQSL